MEYHYDGMIKIRQIAVVGAFAVGRPGVRGCTDRDCLGCSVGGQRPAARAHRADLPTAACAVRGLSDRGVKHPAGAPLRL